MCISVGVLLQCRDGFRGRLLKAGPPRRVNNGGTVPRHYFQKYQQQLGDSLARQQPITWRRSTAGRRDWTSPFLGQADTVLSLPLLCQSSSWAVWIGKLGSLIRPDPMSTNTALMTMPAAPLVSGPRPYSVGIYITQCSLYVVLCDTSETYIFLYNILCFSVLWNFRLLLRDEKGLVCRDVIR